jgi:hypothetical protein
LLHLGSGLGLVAAVAAGGALISVFEDLSYRGGVRIAFSVVSTTGFGEGPKTVPGVLISMAVFAFAAPCWFALLVTGVELGLARYQHRALVQKALRPLTRRRGPRLFMDN